MKKNDADGHFPREKLRLLRKFLEISFVVFLVSIPIKGVSQEKRFTFELKHVPVSTVYLHIEKNSDYSFVYNTREIQRIGLKDYKFENATIQEILDYCLQGTDLKYEIQDKHIIISRIHKVAGSDEIQSIRGQVIGKDSIVLPGVTIILKGTTIGVTTDRKGYYTIRIPKQKDVVLVFSFVGMKTKEIPVKDKNIINITMEEEATTVDEVVVTGYQTLRKSDVVGSVTTVKASDIMMPAYTSIDQMLQGRVAGMLVMNTSSRVGTTPKIRIRGTSTILGNQDPLWVVDGVIQPDPLPINQNDIMVDDLKNILGNQISWLNPADIETITVLKDASATAIYGSKAANGVIVITTKRGQQDQMTVNYSGTFSFRRRPNYNQFNLMNSQERIQFSREAFDAGAVYTDVPAKTMSTYEGIMRLYNDKQITKTEAETAIQKLESTNTDWFKLLTRNSFSHNHNLSISGGNNKIVYNASLGYSDQAGIELNNKAKNLSGRINLGINIHPKIHLDINIVGAIDRTWGYAANVDPMKYATETSRSVLAYDEHGNRIFQQKRSFYTYNKNEIFLNYHILNEVDHSYSKSKAARINSTLNFKWDIFPYLSYEFVGGINTNNINSESYAGEQTYYIANLYRGYDFGSEKYGSDRYKAALLPFGGELYNGASEVLAWNVQNKITFSKTVNEIHRINILIGTEAASTSTLNRSQTIFGYVAERGEQVIPPTPIKEIVPIGNEVTNWGILDKLYNGEGWTRSTMTAHQFSLFATLAYALKNRYVLNASIRNDASNRFGQDQNKRFDPTYSFGLSWNIAQEPWLQSISPVLNQFNLRASFGIQGNTVNSISPELILTMGQIKQYYGEYMSKISRLPNPHLSWERTKTWNFGVDIQMLDWITMNLEYYRKSSNNIVNQKIALEYGREGMEINGGKITNSGIEYTLNITPIHTKDWGWTIGLNSAKNWNKAQTQSISEIKLPDYLNGASDRVLKKGYAISSFWAFKYRKLNSQDGIPEFNLLFKEDENGNFIKDKNGSYELKEIQEYTDMLVYCGKTEPDFTGGLTTRLRWKGLTFGANFSLLLGAKKRLPNPYPADGNIPLSNTNLSKELTKRWKKTGDEDFTNIPGVYSGRVDRYILLQDGNTYNPYNMWGLSDIRVVNASFLRCQQMSLTWNINESWCKRLGIKHLSLNAIVNNVFVIADKKFNGFDPELGNSVQPKTYSLSVSIGL
ncbi:MULTISPECIES: SusC/RagA family TonB-linked outer membrane protein [Sanguibacteroides]|uniref:SusC/RagA family TonB-linked outer membrane protein n=1 Tax=Sanguibacteroides TaxID=1635148 RepID=UPI000DA09669|nr:MULTISPECIES: SusC/RagA family TonB-linked outer membrane protein [Sanguibacteroides]PXZ43332.1 SusC/RagA family TonB-linked outer membrane protein [Sanguibacteroides justesenii]